MSNTPSAFDSIHLVEFCTLKLGSSITAPVYYVLSDIPPFLCQDLRFVLFVVLRWSRYDIGAAQIQRHAGTVDWKFALCLFEK